MKNISPISEASLSEQNFLSDCLLQIFTGAVLRYLQWKGSNQCESMWKLPRNDPPLPTHTSVFPLIQSLIIQREEQW